MTSTCPWFAKTDFKPKLYQIQNRQRGRWAFLFLSKKKTYTIIYKKNISILSNKKRKAPEHKLHNTFHISISCRFLAVLSSFGFEHSVEFPSTHSLSLWGQNQIFFLTPHYRHLSLCLSISVSHLLDRVLILFLFLLGYRLCRSVSFQAIWIFRRWTRFFFNIFKYPFY